jgi:hypothetical protein
LAVNVSINPMISIMSIYEEINFSSLKLYVSHVFSRVKYPGFLGEECGYNFNFFPKNIFPKSKDYSDKTPLYLKNSIGKLNNIQVALTTLLDPLRQHRPLIKMADKFFGDILNLWITKKYYIEKFYTHKHNLNK